MSNVLENIKKQAAALNKCIVLPEGEDSRVVVAAAQTVKEKLARVVLLGNLEEIKAAKQILKSCGLIENVPELTSCPTCGRIQYDMMEITKEIEEFLLTINKDIHVAIMGCAVNGPGEAKEADLGVAGGINEALLFKKGQIVRKIKAEDILEELKKEIIAF